MTAQMLDLQESMGMELPRGFITHPVDLDRAEPVIDLMNAYAMKYLGIKTDTLEEARIYWGTPGYNLATDAIVIHSPQGEVVGFADFWNTIEPHTRFNTYGVVHPEFEHRGIGNYLLDWIESRAREELPRAPVGSRVVINQGVDAREATAMAFLEQHGFQRVRQYYHMHIELDQPPAAACVPAGFEIRPFQGEVEQIEMLRVIWEAFHDHWGFFDEPFENFYRRVMHWNENRKGMDPALWFIALHEGRIAGSCLCIAERSEDPEMAWVNQLGVLRDYRKQGVGLALLRHAFCEFYRRGKKRAGLGVDAGSLTGAVRLYETAGMHVARKTYSYQKVVREGQDLSVQALQS